jgi:hypothetical protein
MRVRPGSIVNVSEYASFLQIYDASFIMNLKAQTPFVGSGEFQPHFSRHIFWELYT